MTPADETILLLNAGHAEATLRALTPSEQARLGSILTRLASPYEGERAAAGLIASAFLAKHHLTWLILADFLGSFPRGPATVDRPQLRQDRRRNGSSRSWRGYCRRDPVPLGQALNCVT